MRPFSLRLVLLLVAVVLLAMDAAALLVLLFLDRLALGAGDLAVSSGGLLHALNFGLAGFHACGFAFAERAGGFALLNAGLLVGLCVGLSGAYASEWSLLSMYILLVVVVTFRARGLWGKKSVLEACR